jgi:predicted enzyme related to lactoylglutathione lyase
MTSDIERAKAFYGEVFGWSTNDPAPEFGGYTNFTKDGKLVAGLMPAMPQGGVADVWSIYLRVADARATTKHAQETGSAVVADAMDVGDLGVMAVITDPGQAVVGMWQPGEHKGFEVYGEPGAPAWWELHTRDYDASIKWYQQVFGWTTQTEGDTPDFRYTTLIDGETMWAGVMDDAKTLPPEIPPHWTVYFQAESTDDTLATVKKAGGGVMMDAENTPYGRLAIATDPMGAPFRVTGPNT